MQHIQTTLKFSKCEITSRPKGGIVNAGNAAVIKADDVYYFIKHNDTHLVCRFCPRVTSYYGDINTSSVTSHCKVTTKRLTPQPTKG